MIIEATQPLEVFISDLQETIHLEPLIPRDLPEEQALKLLAKVPGKVRIYNPVSGKDFKPGTLISWHSPLFGRVNGEVAMEPESGWFVVRCHSVTGGLALISMDWDLRVEKTSGKDLQWDS